MKTFKRTLLFLSPIITIVVVFILLQIVVVAMKIPKFVIAQPFDSLKYIFTSFSKMAPNIWKTLWQYLLGFAVGSFVGIALAFVLSLNEFVSNATWPFLIFLVAIPLVILVPILKIMFGFGNTVSILATILSCFLINCTMTANGIATVPEEMRELIKSCKGTRLQQFVRITVPASLPSIFTGIKLGSIFALSGLMGAEMTGDLAGMGYTLRVQSSTKNFEASFAYLYLIMLLGILVYQFLTWIENRVIKE